MNFYVLKSIEFGPSVISRIFARIDPAKFDEHPDPERFSPREAIAHLADWEPIFRSRMKLILTEPGVTIVGQDESESAIQNRYHEQDVQASLSEFERQRAETTKWIRGLSMDDFKLAGNRDDYGPMTIEDFANLLVCHDMYHVDQFLEFVS
jgi:uncharacterized damage-inducible protein DinB